MTAPAKPNILFFFSDQQRWDTCGCYGQKLPITPNLDRMASEGVRFENAFSCQPVCGPARACLQTGKYATEVNCPTNHCMLPLDETTIAQHLSGAGYEVGYIGKWHLASTGPKDGPDDFRERAVPPERRGGYKDYWLASDVLEFTSHGYDGHMFDAEMNQVDFKGYRADCQTDFVLDYLNTRTGEKPFFLFLSYIEPHHQNDHNCYEGPIGSKERWKDYEVPGDLVDTGGDWRENYPDYLGCCNSLDHNLGRIQEQLEKLGMADNTIILYTSDHGSHFCTRNSEYKRSCHDGCLRVPMIAWGPGFSGGKVVDELVSLIDIPPTILAAGGVDAPASMRGQALQQLAQGTASEWSEHVFYQISESQVGRGIRTHKWKYSVSVPNRAPSTERWKNAASDVYYEEYLYDLEADPHERSNLVREPALADVRAEMAEILKQDIINVEGYEPQILPVEERQ